MRRHLVLPVVLFLLAGFAPAEPVSREHLSADEPPAWWIYLPVVANPPEPTPTPTETSTLTPSPTLTPSATPTETPTLTPSLTPTATRTFTPSPTPTETAPVTPSAAPTATLTPTCTPTPSPTVSPTPSPTRDPSHIEWDPRLDLRGALIQPAQVHAGQWYWRLVKGMWYGENEQPFQGAINIFVDTRTEADQRKGGVPVWFTSLDGETVWATRLTEPKPDCGAPDSTYPGCLYAADFPMFEVAPAYRAIPADGNPADAVTNLGLGSIEDPLLKVHTSYLFVWRWSQAVSTTRPSLGPPAPVRPSWSPPW